MAKLTQDNLDFLRTLKANNNRDWFSSNKDEYLRQHLEIIEFAEDLLEKLRKHDDIETPSGKKALFRIYRDVRFSKDKSPYKTHWAGSFKRATKYLRGGYYFHIEPDGVFIGGGFWAPNKDDLLRIREDIVTDASELRSIINDKRFINTFGSLEGEQLKSCPKGFDKDHPDIDLLRYKQFVVSKKFSNEQALSRDFSKMVDDTFKEMRPFFDYMSVSVTTDANGVSIFD